MTKKVAFYGIFITLALVASYIEILVPIQIGIPGVKIGLANMVTILVMLTIGVKDACYISFIRVVLSGFLFGNLFAIIYSLAGAILSITVMALLKKTNQFSLVGISAAGGVFHNIGQLLVAILVMENIRIGYYFPVLMISGIITGVMIGSVTGLVAKRLPSNLMD